MKLLKIFALAFALVLAGCGGHGYEGTYKATVDMSTGMAGFDKMLFGGNDTTSTTTMILKKNSIQMEDDVFKIKNSKVENKGNGEFLVLELEGETVQFEIVYDELHLHQYPITLRYIKA
ncbi:hypothetical protein [Vibrio maerlii]|uniref:hypothetical protein n=1 Tax=Vibrio maerlii TaxID=2231648 RepID=UPI000E3D77B1|nr:hypothetical protein [Vibrio maerlii]